MIISDLNHLEVVEGADVVGGYNYRKNDFQVDVNIDKNIDIKEDVDILKKFKAKVDVKGNSAIAESKADAFGDDTIAQIFTFTETDHNYSKADGTSISATN
ncbi:hypothetical protein [Scytonema sp. PCC 10023]|uniref:hypothetical protein n=1 Tax=Scytonema sp. PCC 10023 TaxID=1680591 RepID=UPI0039C6E11E